MPDFPFSKIVDTRYPHMISEFFIVDILQCIAIGLLILLLMRIFIKSDKIFYWLLALISLFILAYGPIAWKTDYSVFMPLAVANYFNVLNGSLFPLFPWLAFIFIGAIVGKFYTDAKLSNNERLFATQLLSAGLFFFSISILLLKYFLPDNLAVIKPNYFFFIQRLGIILALLGIFWFYISKKNNCNSFILDVSRESLIVYWLHLKIIYKEFNDDKNLIDILGSDLNVLECIIITIILALIMIVLAKGWGYLKFKYPIIISRLVSAGVIIAVTIFFIF